MKFQLNRIILFIVLLISFALWTSCQKAMKTRVPYEAAIQKLTEAIEYEMQDKKLPALAMVLTDDQQNVWAQSFGLEDPNTDKKADLNTIYRIGSVSKLFTDIGIMQLVERGELDLDAPIQTYLPDFQPENSFDKPITLRQLMSHRSGLIREPRAGHYFDDSSPSLAQTVASLNKSPLIYEPESRVKYSNAGIAVVGYVLEKMKNQPFANYLQEQVLTPMGLRQSAFKPNSEIQERLAVGEMWSYDGRQFDAPTFELGMAPAGSMYATISDLGKFLHFLFNEGRVGDNQILQAKTLEEMWTPQFETNGVRNYGIGFRLDDQAGTRRVGHGGAIYGFATQLYALPEKKLGAACVITADGANTVSQRLAAYALDLMLAVKEGSSLPDYPQTAAIPEETQIKYAGTYRNGDNIIELEKRNQGFFARYNDLEARLKMNGDKLRTDDRFNFGLDLLPEDDGSLTIKDRRFQSFEPPKPPPCPEKFRQFLGEYGWDFNVLIIYEDQGQLHALVEWFFKYPLTEIDENTFAFPDAGLYHGERLQFTRNVKGDITQVEIPHSVVFPRRQNIDAAETFRIQPLLPATVLRDSALAAQPPNEPPSKAQPELAELIKLDQSIQLDIRYAGANNFMGSTFYQQARAFMQKPAAEAVVNAHKLLRTQGYGLLIYDAYRPWYVTKMFWDATPADKKIFVADPSKGSRHNRGCAVDLTLFDLKTGEPVKMLAGYDEMTERSYPHYVGGTSLERWRRQLLRKTMESVGFSVYDFEWWHFDYQAWRDYPIMNVRFEEIN